MREEIFLDHSSSAKTLVDLLRIRADTSPHAEAYYFLATGKEQASHLTYWELDRRARAIAAYLQSLAYTGERALLLYPPGLEYITAFFGCLYAGVVAVPCYPPSLKRADTRLQAIAMNAQARCILAPQKLSAYAQQWSIHTPELTGMHWVVTDEIALDEAGRWQQPALDSQTLAFLQYTSGSTGSPKGVILTHGNLLHNLSWVRRHFNVQSHSHVVSWLPPYHDMGLIGGILQPLYSAIPATLFSPTAFLEQPMRWLESISSARATISGAPNFAFDLCVRKTTAQERATLDLSCWEVAFCGAEPVRLETLEKFAEAFGPCGFRHEALYPCYGLAEATLFVSGADRSVTSDLATERLSVKSVSATVSTNQVSQSLVGCGITISDQDTLIVDPHTRIVCLPHHIGEIWIAGPSVAQGYWQRPVETAEVFGATLSNGQGPFLRTGDLGFLEDGQLFVTGRLKDLIIIRGRNYYPQDIELAVEKSHPALRPGACAAFAVEIAHEERLVIVQEIERQSRHVDKEEVIAAIRSNVAMAHGLHTYAVVLIKPGHLPRTSSGKVQRRHCRALFLEQRLPALGQSLLTDELGNAIDGAENAALLHTIPMLPDSTASHEMVIGSLREHLARLLRVPSARIDIQQPLISLGLDSLKTVELKNALETSFGVVLPMTTLLEEPSVAQLAETILTQYRSPQPREDSVPISAGPVPSCFPLAANQRALWFLYQLQPDDMAYVITRIVRIRGALNANVFQQAWQKLVQRHAVLRTVFFAVEGEPVQEVREESRPFLLIEDASTWSQAQLSQRLQQEVQQPFHLEQGPLLRVSLFIRSPQEHILLFTIHHIVVDFWSLIVLLYELKELYYAEHNPSTLKPVSSLSSYYTYIRWQAEMLKGAWAEQAWAYWQKQLAGHQPFLDLPTDRPRSLNPVRRGTTFDFSFPPYLSSQIRDCAGKHHTTLYTLLMSAFCTLLYHYTEQTDILIGTSIVGRNRAAWMNTIGYFVNPLPIRAKLGANLSFTSLLQQIHETILSAFTWQDFPFIELVNRLRPTRQAGRSPLFQVMFTFQQAPSDCDDALAALALGTAQTVLDWGELTLESLPCEQQATQFDLLLTMAEMNGRLVGSFQYDTDLFDASTIEQFTMHFQALLESLLANPEQRLADMKMLSEREAQQLLIEWNATQTRYDRNVSVHALFEKQAESSPHHIAVKYAHTCLTYEQLNKRANQLAHYLRKLGVAPEVGVGLCLERSLDLLVGILGVLKAGGYYVPLDPQAPPARLTFMLTDAQVTTVLTHERWQERLQPAHVQTVCLDSDWPAIHIENEANLDQSHQPEQLVYMIYTSGSTGRPKGVMIAHHSLVNYLTWCQQAYPLHLGQEVPVHSSATFDLTVTSLIAPLLAGKTVLLLPEEQQLDLLAEALQKDVDFSLIKLPPLHLHMLGEQLAQAEVRGHTHAFIIGGEALLPQHIAFWQAAAPTTELINEYGPTETVVGCCVYRIPPSHQAESTIPIGRPIANTRLYVLNRTQQLAPCGVAGELYIGGAGVARGYHQRPDFTAEKFLPDPFSGEVGARLYKTGDRVRYRADGTLEYLGRIDYQIKLRGFRVELEEIEVILSHHQEVQQAVVLVTEDKTGVQRLAACIVPVHGQTPSQDALRAFLREALPDYMIPSTFLFQTSFPLTSHGKVDREALRQLLPTSQHRQLREEEIPQTDAEKKIGTIWKTILQIDQVGLYENFFDLGGHSLLLVQMQEHLRTQFGQETSLLEIMKHPTIKALADYITQVGNSGNTALQRAVQQSQARAENRLTLMQARQRNQKNRK